MYMRQHKWTLREHVLIACLSFLFALDSSHLSFHYPLCALIRVWNLADRTLVACHPTPHAVRSLAYSPDGSQLSAGMQDGSFVVLNAK